MNDRSQEEEALSQAQILANVERQINAATAAISEACKQLQQEADKLHNERETFDRMSKKIESTQISETVNLNIGGQHFTTTRQTLTKDPNSYFAAMFSGRFSLKRSEDGAIQTIEIDRDGKHFRAIYLTTCVMGSYLYPKKPRALIWRKSRQKPLITRYKELSTS